MKSPMRFEFREGDLRRKPRLPLPSRGLELPLRRVEGLERLRKLAEDASEKFGVEFDAVWGAMYGIAFGGWEEFAGSIKRLKELGIYSYVVKRLKSFSEKISAGQLLASVPHA